MVLDQFKTEGMKRKHEEEKNTNDQCFMKFCYLEILGISRIKIYLFIYNFWGFS